MRPRDAGFSELKIDRSVVTDSGTSKDCRILLKAITDLAHNLDLPPVAEGVETQEVATLLKQKGCEMAQGYFFSRRLPSHAMLRLGEKLSLTPAGVVA